MNDYNEWSRTDHFPRLCSHLVTRKKDFAIVYFNTEYAKINREDNHKNKKQIKRPNCFETATDAETDAIKL